MKLVNANIKSKKELAQRLINGEVFYTKELSKVFYAEEQYKPFRVDNEALEGLWVMYKGLLLEVRWEENITRPVLCRVHDSDENFPLDYLELVISYEEDSRSPYKTSSGVSWKYATPVSKEEAEKWFVE